MIRHFNRLIDPTLGQIDVEGTDVMTLRQKELEQFRRQKMSMVFQRFGLMPHRKVIDNVAYGLEIQGVLTQEGLQEASDDASVSEFSDDIYEEVPSVSPDAAIETVLPETMGCDYSLPVVDEDGNLKGELERSAVAEIFVDRSAETEEKLAENTKATA